MLQYFFNKVFLSFVFLVVLRSKRFISLISNNISEHVKITSLFRESAVKPVSNMMGLYKVRN